MNGKGCDSVAGRNGDPSDKARRDSNGEVLVIAFSGRKVKKGL
jgi:hypothetical protein